ncbi:hypothetical protein ACNKHT_04340 [Shigella flexneri]
MLKLTAGVPAFSPIIERNTTVPVSRVETYSTMHPEQDRLRLTSIREKTTKLKTTFWWNPSMCR